jgi:hypothetical protein
MLESPLDDEQVKQLLEDFTSRLRRDERETIVYALVYWLAQERLRDKGAL